MMVEVVITGLGPVAPNGIGKESYWHAVKKGQSGVKRIMSFNPAGLSCQIAGEIDQADLEESSRCLNSPAPDSKACKLSVIAALLALEDAGLSPKELNPYKSAIFMGVSTTDMEVVQKECDGLHRNEATSPDALVKAYPHAPAVAISQALKAYGKVITISTACTSGLNSIIFGAEAIKRGEHDLVIAGGVDTPLSKVVMSSFCAAKMVPTSFNDEPEKASRPFDAQREGGVLSEGAGVVILEKKSNVLRRGGKIYASVSGGGLSTMCSLLKMKADIYDAMQSALEKAALLPGEIDYISACAPGDLVIDGMETQAIKDLFKARAYSVAISSIKSMIGNPGAASGPLQAIAAALSIENSFIPPTINLKEPGKSCDLDYVPQKGRTARVNHALVNVRGLGGSISSLVLARPG